jgi:hypothetical protein
VSHFIVRGKMKRAGDPPDGLVVYLLSRKSTAEMYVSRACWGADLEEARVFTTKSAATNSCRQSIRGRRTRATGAPRPWKILDPEVVEVTLSVSTKAKGETE